MERVISLRNTKPLYLSGKFKELEKVLVESLIYSSEQSVDSDAPILSIYGQIQMLLEALWCQEKYIECLSWMEKCLMYGVDKFLQAPTHAQRRKDWAETLNYILLYLESLIEQEGLEVLQNLERFLPRLIQTLTKIVTNQLDTQIDNKSNQMHLINVRIPWWVLYQVTQKEDDCNVTAKRKAIAASQEDGIPLPITFTYEALPNSITLFFTAHDFLGRKKWCDKDESKFLLKILDVVTPRLRSPEFEHSRDIVVEMMEQTTFCLYGYPPKKGRSKHIEDHGAKNIELTWERAIQLFDIYRPDNLPEFNSYK